MKNKGRRFGLLRRMVTVGVALRGYAGEPAGALPEPGEGLLGAAAFLMDKVRP